MPASAVSSRSMPSAISAERGGGLLRGFVLRLRLAGGKALAIGQRFGVRAPAFGLDQRDGRPFAGGEILIEQIFGGSLSCISRSALRRRGSW